MVKNCLRSRLDGFDSRPRLHRVFIPLLLAKSGKLSFRLAGAWQFIAQLRDALMQLGLCSLAGRLIYNFSGYER